MTRRRPWRQRKDMRRLLEADRSLLRAWSFRGAPVVFPTGESGAFLSALIPQPGEEWIYTQGIDLALDQTLAQWLVPLLPSEKRQLWSSPSMYADPAKQTVGGAAVSFLLRPCAFMGRVVFARREGNSPTFTGYSHWVGRLLAKRGRSLGCGGEEKSARPQPLPLMCGRMKKSPAGSWKPWRRIMPNSSS